MGSHSNNEGLPRAQNPVYLDSSKGKERRGQGVEGWRGRGVEAVTLASRKGLEFMDATQKITGRQLGPQGPGHEQTQSL